MHRHGGPGSRVEVFSRTLADITARVPELVEVVSGFPGGSLILDGETLTLDENGAPRPFQETLSRFGSTGARAEILRPWFFDILHADGVDLIDEPLSVRAERLREAVGEHGILALETADPVAAETFSQEALAATLRRLVASGRTIVVVLHELGELADLISRAVVLRHGRIVHDGAPPRAAHGHDAADHDHVHVHGDPEPRSLPPVLPEHLFSEGA